MSVLSAVLLGLVQGIAEFLPISSSGHLMLLEQFFHIQEADMLFDVLLHLGTLLAVVATYRKDLRGILRGGLGLLGLGRDRGKTTRKNLDRRRMALFLLVGTLPLLLVLPLYDWVQGLFSSTVFVSVMLLLNGTALYFSDRFSGGTRTHRDMSALQALLVGLCQVVAVIPGLSRAGSTIAAGRACGFQRAFAVRFSFLLSVPAILGAAVLSLVRAGQSGVDLSLLPMYLVGMAAAAFSGYFSIRLLRWLANRHSLGGFAYYCWGAGIVCLVLSLVA
jgi:undecaprenyl-diphosphatase